jgi:hypothetical protein
MSYSVTLCHIYFISQLAYLCGFFVLFCVIVLHVTGVTLVTYVLLVPNIYVDPVLLVTKCVMKGLLVTNIKTV